MFNLKSGIHLSKIMVLMPVYHEFNGAEDGLNNFSPSTGVIREMTMPHGLGVRLDEGVRTGQEITPYYDPLLCKLITWGDDRQSALDRMCRALGEFHIAGIESTIPLCKMIFLHPAFQKGKYNTHTLDAIKEELRHKLTIHSEDRTLAARIGAVKLHKQARAKSNTKWHH
jgi:acetyl/propionyl-CoA carboxylase alpha subunit